MTLKIANKITNLPANNGFAVPADAIQDTAVTGYYIVKNATPVSLP